MRVMRVLAASNDKRKNVEEGLVLPVTSRLPLSRVKNENKLQEVRCEG